MPIPTGTIKFISNLRQKKVRQNYHKFTVEGPRAVAELLLQQRYHTDRVYALPGWIAETDLPASVAVTEVSPKELGRMSQLTTPHRVLAVVDMPEPAPAAVPPTGWSLYLDGVQSPSNLGALLRIADWFGFSHVYGGPGTADLYAPKSIQASMGSFLRVHYGTAGLAELTAAAPDVVVYGADLAGERVFDIDPPGGGILVVGAEGPGIGAGARVQIDRWIHVPRAPGRAAESLNVAVATGILCAALTR